MISGMDRRQLEYFLAIVESGGVTRAAHHLHVTQPTISAGLRALEKELGGALFERAGGRLILTPAGTALVDPARRVLRDFEAASETVDHVLGLRGGYLDIGAVPALAVGWLTPVLAGYRQDHPDVSIRVFTDADGRAIADGVRSGRFQVGLTVDKPFDTGFTSTVVGEQRVRALLPPGFRAPPEPIPVEELAEMDLVTLYQGRSTSRRWLEAELGKRGLSPRIRIELGSVEGVAPLVASGAGYALWWTPMDPATSGACVLHPLNPDLRRPIYLTVREGPAPPSTLAFLRAVHTVSEGADSGGKG